MSSNLNRLNLSNAQPLITGGTIKELSVPYSKHSNEQEQIVSFLDTKCSEIDILIKRKTALLEELENYKKSVIYEYVTGKKEV